MNVNLGPTFDDFVADLLKTGLYQSQSEILREALRLLKEREELKGLRLTELRKESLSAPVKPTAASSWMEPGPLRLSGAKASGERLRGDEVLCLYPAGSARS